MAAGRDQGAVEREAPLAAPRLRLSGHLPTPDAGALPPRTLALRFPEGASSCPARTSRLVLPGGHRGPAPRQPTHPSLSSLKANPRPARLSRTHLREALGAPASGRRGPAQGRGGGGTAGSAGPGALPGRADAQAPSRPRSRTTAPSAHPHAHAGSARRAGSAADASAGARGIPGMRRRPPSPGFRRAQRARQATPPGPPLPPSRWGPGPGEPSGRRGWGLTRPTEARFPSPARRAAAGSHPARGCRRSPAANVGGDPGLRSGSARTQRALPVPACDTCQIPKAQAAGTHLWCTRTNTGEPLVRARHGPPRTQ